MWLKTGVVNLKVCIGFPWQRIAVIAELSERLAGLSPQFGKTALQKMVFLLQEIYAVNCDYEYSLYTYGPYCVEVLNDLDLAQSLSAVEVACVQEHGVEIRPGSSSSQVREKAQDFLCANEQAFDGLVQRFGRFSAKELELRSTIVYVDRDYRRGGASIDKTNFVRLVSEIKPKFDLSQIRSAYDELATDRLIQVRE